jgi:phage/plasmid-like protein (TIGR03299 family)
MSQEQAVTLNNDVLVGYTETRGGHAWHYRLDLQGAEGGMVHKLGLSNNHFPGPIPKEVAEKFFDLNVSRRQLYIRSASGDILPILDYAAWCADDNDSVMGIHSDGYQGHQYKEWLYDNVLRLVNGVAGLGSLAYLKKRAVAFASIEVPENIKTPEGVEFRPWLMATTSFNGQIPTTYKRGKTFPLCDNTMQALLGEKGFEFRVKHTRNSLLRIKDAQQALALIEEVADETAAEIAALCQYRVTEDQFQAFLSQLVPMPEVEAKDINVRDYSTRSATMAANKREKLNELYRMDGRAAPWQGTAFGILQATNTYAQHYAIQRNVESRYQRNMESVISGKARQSDIDAMALLQKICDRQLVAA